MISRWFTCGCSLAVLVLLSQYTGDNHIAERLGSLGIWDLWEALETTLGLASPHSPVVWREGLDSPQQSFE